MSQTVIRVTDDADRATIEVAIAELMVKMRRMPKHWDQRRAEVADEVDALVDRWLLASS